MKTWLAGALVGACVGVVIYLLLSSKSAPPAETRHTPLPQPATAPASPAAPVVLTEVVEVTDIDHLLDPPARPDTGVPFDEVTRTSPVSAEPARIPPATDGPELAPMPRPIPDGFTRGGSFHF
jgi:hypothetical protein